jgi:prepilin-type N-terminal cleavage/methylation domain-containing protein
LCKKQTGKNACASGNRGVTLIEMLVVITIASLLVGISFPAVSSGLDSLRLNSAANDVVSFINTGLSRAGRGQQVVEVTISKAENRLSMRSSDPNFTRTLSMPDGVSITKILPELPEEVETDRIFMLYPGGTVPPVGVTVMNRRHMERIVEVDPMTGVAVLNRPQP